MFEFWGFFFFRGSGFLYNYKLKFVVKEEGWAEVAERDNKYLYDGGRGENMQCTSCYEWPRKNRQDVHKAKGDLSPIFLFGHSICFRAIYIAIYRNTAHLLIIIWSFIAIKRRHVLFISTRFGWQLLFLRFYHCDNFLKRLVNINNLIKKNTR